MGSQFVVLILTEGLHIHFWRHMVCRLQNIIDDNRVVKASVYVSSDTIVLDDKRLLSRGPALVDFVTFAAYSLKNKFDLSRRFLRSHGCINGQQSQTGQ